MASPITTQGFTVSERPGINYLDPRLFASGLGDVVPNIGRGLELVGDAYRMRENADLRPVRAELAQIQLENAQNRLAMAPLERQLTELRLGEEQRQAAMPVFKPGDIMFEDTTVEYPAALDDQGMRTGPSETVMGDLVQVTQGIEYGPGGVATPVTRRQTVKTAAQRAEEAALKAAQVEATRALATQRNRGKEYEFTRLTELRDDAMASGDTEGAAMYDARIKRLTQLNPEFRTVASGVDQAGNLVINQVDASGNLRSIPTGQKKNTANDWVSAMRAYFDAPNTSSNSSGVSTARPTALATLTVDQARAATPGTKFLGTDGRARIKNADGTVSIIVE
jgi:hypothetical protein